MKFFLTCAAIGALSAVSAKPLHAQLLYGGVRVGAGIPAGTFAQSATAATQNGAIRGATTGLGYGAEAGFGLGLLGLYAAYERIDFGCDAPACASGGKYRLTGGSGGVRFGVPLIPIVKPWVKAGVTFNQITGTSKTAAGTNIATNRSPGYEIGAGVDIPVMFLLSLTPQVRYVGQKLAFRGVSAGSKSNVSYYTFDIGLKARTPF